MELSKRIASLLVGLGGDIDQGRLIGSIAQMPIDCVKTDIGLAAHVPAGKGGVAVIEDLTGRLEPVDEACLLAPEVLPRLN